MSQSDRLLVINVYTNLPFTTASLFSEMITRLCLRRNAVARKPKLTQLSRQSDSRQIVQRENASGELVSFSQYTDNELVEMKNEANEWGADKTEVYFGRALVFVTLFTVYWYTVKPEGIGFKFPSYRNKTFT